MARGTFHWIVHDRPPGLKLYYALDWRRSHPKAMW
ncbi:hypothetical protein J2X54_005034 [Duganella sp. 3397]|nr:hypothetical protein [Duganella sp. 3397]